MKFMKIMLLSIISTVTMLASQSTVLSPTSAFLKGLPNRGFELYNKAPNAITIALFINGQFNARAVIMPNDKFFTSIDLQQPIEIGIYEGLATITVSMSSQQVTPAPQYSYTINAPGKIKYLTWNPAKSPILYPQTGTFMGLSGISDSGYPLKDNITRGQISRTR